MESGGFLLPFKSIYGKVFSTTPVYRNSPNSSYRESNETHLKMTGFPIVIVSHQNGKPPVKDSGPTGSINKLGHVRSVNLEVELAIDSNNVEGITKIILKEVPEFLINAFQVICRKSNMSIEGLFRKEGHSGRINRNNQALYLGESSSFSDFNVHDVCCLVKKFLRDLKVPLIYGAPLKKKLYHLGQKSLTQQISRQEVTGLFDAQRDDNGKLEQPLEQSHLGTLGYIMRQLNWIVAHSTQHNMDAYNVAVCFAPTVFRDDVAKKRKDGRRGSHEDLLNNAKGENELQIAAVRLLIEKANWIGLPTDFYVTSGKPRSASLVPYSRSPLVHDMTNVSKEKALSKRLSMKLGKGNSNALPVAKPNERRSSSGFRDLFHKLRRRSNSRERVPERRSTMASETLDVLKSSTSTSQCEPSPVSTYVLHVEPDDEDDVTPTDTLNTSDSSNRQSRSLQRRMTPRQPTPGPSEKRTTTQADGDETPKLITRVKSNIRKSPPPPFNIASVSKSLITKPVCHSPSFSESTEARKREKPAKARRHTTPVKSYPLRRNQPNTQHSGLRIPKRRVTSSGDHEKENDPKRRSLSMDRSYVLETEESSPVNSVDILEQKGNESRMRRVKLNNKRREHHRLMSEPKLVDAATSPMTASPLRSVGTATVSQTVVVDSQSKAKLDFDPILESSLCSPESSHRSSPYKHSIHASPNPPPLPEVPPPTSASTSSSRLHLVAQRSLDAQLRQMCPDNNRELANRLHKISSRPSIHPKPVPLEKRGMSLSALKKNTVDDSEFANSDANKSRILSSSTGEWPGCRKSLEQRPSVAFIRNAKHGLVKDRIHMFSQMQVMEPISGRSSVMSNRTSLGGQSTFSDFDDIKPSAPPVGYTISLGNRSLSTAHSSSFVSPQSSPRSP